MYVLMILPFEDCKNVTDKCMPDFPKEIFYFKKYSYQNFGGNYRCHGSLKKAHMMFS